MGTPRQQYEVCLAKPKDYKRSNALKAKLTNEVCNQRRLCVVSISIRQRQVRSTTWRAKTNHLHGINVSARNVGHCVLGGEHDRHNIDLSIALPRADYDDGGC
jgi:hypothetical protein